MDRMHTMIPAAGLALALLAAGPVAAQDEEGTKRAGVRAFLALDANGDRQVTLDEFVSARLERTANRFERRDTDGDGFLDGDDFTGEPPEDFDREAFRTCVAAALDVELPEPPVPGDRLAAIDLDGDGAVSLDEALIDSEARAIERFDEIDADADGAIGLGELRRALRVATRLRAVRRDCREQQQDMAAILGL